MLLNVQGRVLFDAVVFASGSAEGEFLVDCHAEAAERVLKHLRMYRVRRKIDLELDERARVAVVPAVEGDSGLVRGQGRKEGRVSRRSN